MPWAEALRPVRMRRVALVAPRARLREALVVLAGSGLVELDVRPLGQSPDGSGPAPAGPGTAGALPKAAGPPLAPGFEARLAAEGRLQAQRASPRVLASAPNLDELEHAGRWDLVAGELELDQISAQAVEHRAAAVLVGWVPQDRLGDLSARLAAVGAAVAELPRPAGAQVPTLIAGSSVSKSFRPLVDIYGTVPYADVDPAIFAGVTYMLMFGMMFGDVGHGLILAGLGLYLRISTRPFLASLQSAWPIVVGAGLAGAFFGALYGEVFGPTGILPAVWLEPLSQPVALLGAGVVFGAVLLGASYIIGLVNRVREGGAVRALYASTGVAGACLYFGAGAAVAGIALNVGGLVVVGAATAGIGLILLFIGFLAAAGGGIGGGVEAFVELVDAVIRTASNAVSFARLAAFGLTHAAIGGVVWSATTAMWASGGLGLAAGVAIFAAGNGLAFGLEALVAGIQSLRLEYYELFSRIFTGEGRVFVPWHLTVVSEE